MKTMLVFSALASACLARIVAAQTLNDPTPILGNGVTNAASASAMNSALSPRNSQRTPEQNAARQRDLAANNACRDRALRYPAGKARRAIRDQCAAEFEKNRRFWK
jgi:hypothetical protein